MKIYINKLKENWVVDNVISEWKKFNEIITTDNIKQADIIWLIAPWTWKKEQKKRLKTKKVICTIHHIDFEKFDDKEKTDFYKRDGYVDVYHTVSYKTKEQLETLTNKNIFVIPFWLNQDNFYEITFENLGGLVMPVLLTFTFEDDSSVEIRLPAEVWAKYNYKFTKVFKFSKKVKEVELDKFLETADVDRDNNYWPERNLPSRFQIYKSKDRKSLNQMQIQQN